MRAFMMFLTALVSQVIPGPGATSFGQVSQPPESSSYFAYADREFIFTIEIVKSGVPILNFVSMSEEQRTLFANQIRFEVGNRRIQGKLFQVDTGNPKEPLMTASFRIRPRSSFGAAVKGELEDAKEFSSITLQIGSEVFKLVPLTGFDFENLVLKVNRINLDSPDFSDDWRILKLDYLGTRSPALKSRRER
jgi:hypothetical protein